MNVAYETLEYERVSEDIETNDPRPLLKLRYANDTGLLHTDSGEEIMEDVDGIGDEPYFFIRYTDNGKETTIRFNMVVPEYYPK